MKKLVFCVLMYALASQTAKADSFQEFVRITCVPETRYFEVEYVVVPADAVFVGSNYKDSDVKARLALWESRGYYAPTSINYECAVGDSVYRVTTFQPSASDGFCGGAPEITFTLERNGTPWVNKVKFGSSCGTVPGVSRIAIREEMEGWVGRTADLCVAIPELSKESVAITGRPPSVCNWAQDEDVERMLAIQSEELNMYGEFLVTHLSELKGRLDLLHAGDAASVISYKAARE